MAKAKDLTGLRVGRLVVLRLNPEPYRSPSGKPTRRWDCRCDCGKEVTVLTNMLTAGKILSCGCLQREAAEAQAHDLTGQRFGLWTVLRRAPLKQPERNGSKNGWLCRCDCGTERVLPARALTGGKSRSCGCDRTAKAKARIDQDNVLGRYAGTVVSAIQPDRPPNVNSKSGVKGVHWSDREGCWIAKIGFRGRTITLGRFARLEDAAKARAEAEEALFAPIIEAYNNDKTGGD